MRTDISVNRTLIQNIEIIVNVSSFDKDNLQHSPLFFLIFSFSFLIP